jgi:hypothetical protein
MQTDFDKAKPIKKPAKLTKEKVEELKKQRQKKVDSSELIVKK